LKLLKDESGQAIAEFAMMLPVFVLVSFCIVDIQWMTKQASNVDYIANEVARCDALATMNLPAMMRCSPNGGGPTQQTATDYAVQLARDLRLGTGTQLVISFPDILICNPATYVCRTSISYQYQPLGVWFPGVTITRIGTASYVP
jgi:hypothetical protein